MRLPAPGFPAKSLAPPLLGFLDPLPYPGRSLRVDQGADDRLFPGRVSRQDFRFDGLEEDRFEGLIDLPVHQEALHRDADLAGVGEGADGGPARRVRTDPPRHR